MMPLNHRADDKVTLYDIKASLQYRQADDLIYQDISLSLPLGKVTCLVGQSGCGKSSLLKQLVGLHRDAYVTSLSIKETHSEVQIVGQFQQNIAYMAQQDLLLPWLSVIDNVLLAYDLNRPLFSKKAKHSLILQKQALSILEQVGMLEKAHVNVFSLSGGMRQRVALARTLIQDKPIILMDEPFSSVDAITRFKLQQLSSVLFRNKTVLFVTHDPLEALIMGHEILLFPLNTAAKNLDSKKPVQGIVLENLSTPESSPPRKIGDELSHYHGRLMQRMQAQV